ncbi:MAG: phosphodiester glycosidase family protein [Candidatus Marinimicrobia bacterium]|nr:phosphodiester glycosidase family protein [Candidatus Neomarinimicrobiota bacterium]MCF7923159.1 phosphodiester glycosidase family protein [Candidatus Neomarinimicrobiota bacterium]
MMYRIFTHIFILALFIGCNKSGNPPHYPELGLEWTAIDSINKDLPEGITVYQSIHVGANLRAWYVRVKESLPQIETRVVLSVDDDRRETVSDFAQRLGAPVVINGGYFRMDLNPAKHVGLLKVDGELIHAATASVLRGEERFYLHRSAIGFNENDSIGINWVSSSGDSVFSWEQTIENAPGMPGLKADTSYSKFWSFRDILGAGPILIRHGEEFIPVNEEVFFGTSIPEVHPRTAAGVTSDGDLILLLVDGRQLISRGVDLPELAHILLELGCEDAINLDGGGSSALVVNGNLLNRPAGTTTEREVMSAIAVFSK